MDFKSLSNKQFAYQCIQLLKEHGRLDDRNINILTDPEICRRMFLCSGSFPILQEVPIGSSDEELTSYCYDGTGRQRYYKDIIEIGNKGYVITNHWYGPDRSMPDNRSPFETWVTGQIN